MNAFHRPSFELKLRRNAWAAGAPPRTQLGAYSTSPEPLARLRGPTSKGDGRGEERVGEGKWYPHFVAESYAPGLGSASGTKGCRYPGRQGRNTHIRES